MPINIGKRESRRGDKGAHRAWIFRDWRGRLRESRLKFSRTKRFDRFSVSELSHLASKALLPRKLVLDAAGETVELFHQKWRAEKTNLPLTTNVVRTIEDHLRTIPIA